MTLWAESPHSRPRLLRRLPRPDLSEPLLRNGLALSLSAILSSAIGFVFWLLAAHRYPPAVVGADAVAISALQLVGGVAQLNLTSGMIRFLPIAGAHRQRFIVGAYALSSGIALVLGIGFVVVAPVLAAGLRIALDGPGVAAIWVLATAAWSIFALEDGALTGLRHARWVPIENAGHGLLKAVLVVPLALVAPQAGIFLAWGVATLATILVTNVFLFGRAVPAEQQRAPEGRLNLGEVWRYLSFDYLASLSWLGCTNLLPLFIIRRAGAPASAFFSLAWVVTYVLYLVSISLGSSLIVESAAEPSGLRQTCRRVVGQLLRLLAPAVAIVVIGAPLILRLFGSAYANAGVTTLRVLAVSALPFALVSTVISGLRVLRRTRVVFLINATFLVIVGGVTWFGIPRLGILAAAVAWLGAQVFVACAMVIVLAIRRPLTWRVGAAAMAAMCSLEGARLATFARLPCPTGLRLRRRERRAESYSNDALADFLRIAPASAAVERTDVASSGSDLVVLFPRDAHGTALSVLKIPTSEAARADLLRQQTVLNALAADEQLKGWHRLLPQYRLVVGTQIPLFAIEAPMPGLTGLRLMHDTPAEMPLATRLALEAIGELHACSATPVHLGAADVRRLLDPMLAPLREVHPTGRVPSGQHSAIERLDERLSSVLEGRTLELSWIHGDFTPANVFFGHDPLRVEGVIDWGQARDASLPILDVMSWVGDIARSEQHSELGTLLRRLLAAPRWPTEGTLGAAAAAIDRCGLPFRDVILLYWLSHVDSNLAKSHRRYVGNALWWVRNIEPVLQALSALAGSALLSTVRSRAADVDYQGRQQSVPRAARGSVPDE